MCVILWTLVGRLYRKTKDKEFIFNTMRRKLKQCTKQLLHSLTLLFWVTVDQFGVSFLLKKVNKLTSLQIEPHICLVAFSQAHLLHVSELVFVLPRLFFAAFQRPVIYKTSVTCSKIKISFKLGSYKTTRTTVEWKQM